MLRSLALLPLLALAGCPTKDGGLECDDMAVTSVMVHVSTESGDAVSPTVEFSADDGATFQACTASTDTGVFACGFEQAGALRIRVSAEGYATEEQGVIVEHDECHVITETIDVTLGAVDCTDVELPSVLATVVGSSGEALEGVEVEWTHPDTGVVAACDHGDDDRWVCGNEVAGAILVTARADGHVEESVTVEVGADECHVRTESVEFQLDWGAD